MSFDQRHLLIFYLTKRSELLKAIVTVTPGGALVETRDRCSKAQCQCLLCLVK